MKALSSDLKTIIKLIYFVVSLLCKLRLVKYSSNKAVISFDTLINKFIESVELNDSVFNVDAKIRIFKKHEKYVRPSMRSA